MAAGVSIGNKFINPITGFIKSFSIGLCIYFWDGGLGIGMQGFMGKILANTGLRAATTFVLR